MLAPGPLALWPLDETSGAVANDRSGNARHMTINGSPAFTTRFLDGSLGMTFDGSNDYCTIADAAWMDVATITVICFHQVSIAAQRILVCRDAGGGASDRPWTMSADTNGKISAFSNNQAGPVKSTTSTTAASSDRWHSIAWAFDNGTGAGSHHVDGVLDNNYTGGGSMGTGAAPIQIGMYLTSTAPALGGIRYVGVYGSVLSSDQILSIMRAGHGAGYVSG